MIRAATPADLATLQDIERAAGELFRPLGMALVADDDPPSITDLQVFVDVERAWVVYDDGSVAGYLLAHIVDGSAHVEQVTVHPRHSHRRLGVSLIEHLAEWAIDRSIPALTLTTYRDVAWNGPYYESLGFRWLANRDLTPGLRRIRQHEVEHGLDQWPRACMRRDL